MIMIDELHYHPKRVGRVPPGYWCHLTTDEDIEGLHEFARKIGLKREWFQDHPIHPHYDLTARRRKMAWALGALFIPAREQARARLKKVGVLR
jgi:hypothetical protein